MLDLCEVSLPTPAENLALDEWLLERVGAGAGEALRLWQCPVHAVVLGAGGRVADDVDRAACEAAGVGIVRRTSGGGTVLIGPGCLMVSLALSLAARPALRDIRASHCAIGRQTAAALDIPGLAVAGTGDLAIDGRKVSGSAQRRTRDAMLHHFTLLVGMDVALMARCLREPPRQPNYRQRRPHAAFVSELPLTADAVRCRLIAGWGAGGDDALAVDPARLGVLAARYGDPAWTFRR